MKSSKHGFLILEKVKVILKSNMVIVKAINHSSLSSQMIYFVKILLNKYLDRKLIQMMKNCLKKLSWLEKTRKWWNLTIRFSNCWIVTWRLMLVGIQLLKVSNIAKIWIFVIRLNSLTAFKVMVSSLIFWTLRLEQS